MHSHPPPPDSSLPTGSPTGGSGKPGRESAQKGDGASRPRIVDPGSSRWAMIAGSVGLVLAIAIIALQNAQALGIGGGPSKAGPITEITPPGATDQQLALARLLYGLSEMAGEDPKRMARFDMLFPERIPENGSELQILRGAILEADIGDLKAAVAALEGIAPDAQERGPVAADAELVLRIINSSVASLSKQERDGLVERHGLFGNLALALGRGEASEEMREVIRESRRATIGTLVFASWQILLGLLGVGVLVLFAFLLAGKRMRPKFDPPAPGGSVYLEMFPIFLVLFVLSGAIKGVLDSATSIPPAYTSMVQWIVALVIFWPMVRGVKFSRMRRDLGLHSGEGVWKEIACGVLAYCATMPVYWVAAISSGLLQQAMDLERPDVVGETIAGINGYVQMIALASLVVLWAPIVEEVVFRGSLHRHLRARLRAGTTIAITAVGFALVHSYGPVAAAPLIVLGVSFALMREWRGSLIAPMTAHFMHNGVMMAFLLSQTM